MARLVITYPPSAPVDIASAPIQFLLDGTPTDVSMDTGTPANSTPLPVIQLDSSGNPVTPFDAAYNYGISSDALRTAAQIGNASGAASFGAGATGAQVLRTVIEDQSRNAIGTTADSSITNPATSGSFISFLKGILSTLLKSSTAIIYEGARTLVTRDISTPSNTIAMPVIQMDTGGNYLPPNQPAAQDYGDPSEAWRTAAQIGNSTGAADFDFDIVGPQTLRVAAIVGNRTGPFSYDAGASDGQTPRIIIEEQMRNATGAITDTAITNPASSASMVALLKGLLTNTALGSNSQTGTITSTQKTVGTSAVRGTVSGSAPSSSRKKLFLKPTIGNSGRIWFGPSGVTISTGMEIVGPDRLEFDYDGSDYYLISDTAAQTVEIIEVI